MAEETTWEFEAPKYFDFNHVDSEDDADRFFDYSMAPGMATPAPRPSSSTAGNQDKQSPCFLPVPLMSEVKPVKAKLLQANNEINLMPHSGRVSNKMTTPHSIPKRRMFARRIRNDKNKSDRPIRMRRVIPKHIAQQVNVMSHTKRNLLTSSARKKIKSPIILSHTKKILSRDVERLVQGTGVSNEALSRMNNNKAKPRTLIEGKSSTRTVGCNMKVKRLDIRSRRSINSMEDSGRRSSSKDKSRGGESTLFNPTKAFMNKVKTSHEETRKTVAQNLSLPIGASMTKTEPFSFILDERLKEREIKRKEELKSAEKRLAAGFKASECKVVKTPPFLPKMPPKNQIASVAPTLRLDRRAEERGKWEEQKHLHEREKEEFRRAEELKKIEVEKNENIILRKQLVHKPQPVMKGKYNINIVKKPLTTPLSPAITKMKKI